MSHNSVNQSEKLEVQVQPDDANVVTKTQVYNNDLNQSKAHSIISHQSRPESLLKYFENYEPKSKFINLEQLKKSDNLKLKKYRQSVYYGQYVNGKRHGLGVMVYDNGRLYEGNWQSDYKHGKGHERFDNQSVYEGDYVNGKPQGVGKYLWKNGQSYDGQWCNGMKHGSGMWKGSKGDTYIGQWRIGKADGYGVHTWTNGDRYQGQFKECLKHGQGIERFSNGDIYKGNYQQGKPNGFGEYYWSNGSYFKGQFKNGLRDGQGVWKRSHGSSDKYQGEYKNDKKQGYGIFTWAMGNIYKGNYQNDMRNGYGQMYWTDGSIYKGAWKNGIQHGKGQIYAPGEGTKKGLFQQNVLVVVEKQQYENGYLPGSNFPKSSNNNPNPNPNPKITYYSKKQRDSFMPSRIQFATHEPSSKPKSRQPKSLDENLIVRYGNQAPSGTIYNNNPLLPKKFLFKKEQKFMTFDKKSNCSKLPATRENQRQRILHSSYYMHQFHTRAATTIYGSRVVAKNGYSSSFEYPKQSSTANNPDTYPSQPTNQEKQKGNRKSRKIIEQLRYYNKTRASKNSKTPNI